MLRTRDAQSLVSGSLGVAVWWMTMCVGRAISLASGIHVASAGHGVGVRVGTIVAGAGVDEGVAVGVATHASPRASQAVTALLPYLSSPHTVRGTVGGLLPFTGLADSLGSTMRVVNDGLLLMVMARIEAT